MKFQIFTNLSLLFVLLGCMKANMKIQFKNGVAVSNMCNCFNAIVFYSDYHNKHHMDVDNSSMIQNIDKLSIRAVESIEKLSLSL